MIPIGQNMSESNCVKVFCMRFISSVVLAVAASSLSFGKDMFKPSEADQVKLGLKTAADLRKKEKVLPDTDPRVLLVRRVGRNITDILRVEEKGKPWQYTFDVIESKQVNAFALPGGPMFVYTGLLEKMKTEDELAAVLGHELTHVRREHWANQYAASMRKQLGAIFILSIFRASKSAGDITSIALNLDDLHHSRKDETQADEGGFGLMMKAGFSPYGMVDTFKLLKAVGGSGGPDWMSDHPDTDWRIKNIQSKIAGTDGKFPNQRPITIQLTPPPPPKTPTPAQPTGGPVPPAAKPPMSV